MFAITIIAVTIAIMTLAGYAVNAIANNAAYKAVDTDATEWEPIYVGMTRIGKETIIVALGNRASVEESLRNFMKNNRNAHGWAIRTARK